VAATAPVCNVTVTSPAADPTAPKGFRILPPNATLQDVISAFNYNFSPQVQDAEFNRRLAQISACRQRAFALHRAENQIPKAMDDRIKRINFVEKASCARRSRWRTRRTRSSGSSMTGSCRWSCSTRSGATWVWKDTKTGDANGQGNPDATISGG
jgi:hypothetical protein